MTLDLAQVSPQIRQMGSRLRERREQLGRRIGYASGLLESWSERWSELAELAERRERSQRLASPREPLTTRVGLPPLPPDHRVVATDGSQIEPERHGLAEYFLLNVGWAVLRYGPQPDALLASQPYLKYEPKDLFVRDEQGRRRVPVQGSHLSNLRSVMELEKAVELSESGLLEVPLVVLQDGTLLLWVLEERPEDFLRDAILRPYVAAMARCAELGRPLASYISRPRGTEVSALLRAASCDGRVASCRQCQGTGGSPSDFGDCSLDALHDRLLFEHLRPGQRSAVFATTLSPKLEEFYAGQRVHFFFLNVGSEIGRVEVPEWVAQDPAQLRLVHSVIYDQCQRGQGYPVALTRAHECAIVRGADRRMVRLLLESLYAREGLQARFSEKEAAKRLRAV
jgi:hypothetical protein